MNTHEFINKLNNRYFNGELSVPFCEQMGQLPMDRPDVFAFVQRMFAFMKSSGLPAKDVSLLQADVISTLLARILPGAWEGRIPPITVQGRHAVVDQYIKNNSWMSSGGKKMLDIGCGFPPFTTLESADYLNDWKITGADPSLPAYLIYDADGNYATLDEQKSTVYFQPAMPSVESWNQLLSDSAATKKRFENLLDELLKQSVTEGFPRVEINPIRSYETERISFITGGIGQITIQPQDLIRCFNVLYYFDAQFQQKALQWFAQQLNEGGILLFGGDWAVSTECYYDIYRKENGQLVSKEFAFSIDCICPFGIVTWYCLHEDEPQKAKLMNCIRMIREDKNFMDSFYAFHDAQRARYNLCARDKEGYYGSIAPDMQPQVLWTLAGTMLTELNDAGFNQKAA
ncbi:MAG: hypothetical protein HYR66_11710, partial [Sphingobacteriales bacterium]|nr:hypothetical protein [Sphingobacteriales bacterium]